MPGAAIQEASPKTDLPNANPAPRPPSPEAPFTYPREQQSLVLSHWYALVPNFNTSSREFYAALNKELENRQIPGLSVNRAYQSGVRTLCLDTALRRPLTLNFYRKHGYQENGRSFYGAVETVQFSKTLDERDFKRASLENAGL